MQALVDIELAFMSKQTRVDLSTTPTCIPYVIDFVSMEQTRHGYGTRRSIKRVNLLYPLHDYLKDCGRPVTTGTTSLLGSGSFIPPAAVPSPSYGSGTFTSPATAMLSAGKSSPRKDKSKKGRGKKSPTVAPATASTSSVTPMPQAAVCTSGWFLFVFTT